MINNSIVKIIRPGITEKKFYKALKRINKLSNKYPVFMGIDYEFNTKKIALMQILFEIDKKDKVDKKDIIIKKYYIIYPPELNLETIDYLKNNILSNLKILKILHGSESLDIPYIVDNLYNNDIEKLIDFFLSMIDTRFLCEYLNLKDNIQPNICRIYDLLLKLNIIDQQTKNDLDLNETKMGPIYDIFIDINDLSPELITYAIHDVVYLIDAFKNLKNQIIKYNPKDYYLLIDCLRYCFLERKNITNIGDDLIIINMMNNYFYYIKKNNISESISESISEYISESITDTDTNTDTNNSISESDYYKISLIKTYELILKEFTESFDNIKYILGINFIKTNILNLLKSVVYVLILKYYKVKSSNTQTVEYNLNLRYSYILDGLKIFNLNYLFEFIEKFYTYADIKLKP